MTTTTQLIWTIALAGGLLLGLVAVASSESGTVPQTSIATLQATSPAHVWLARDRWDNRGWRRGDWDDRGWRGRDWDRDDWRWRRWHDRDDYWYYQPYYVVPSVPYGDDGFFWYRGHNYGFGFGF